MHVKTFPYYKVLDEAILPRCMISKLILIITSHYFPVAQYKLVITINCFHQLRCDL